MYGSGTPSDPYCIEDVMDLQAIRFMDMTANYRLVEDIDAQLTSGWNGGEGFLPINYFQGAFDGQNHMIDKLYLNRPMVSNQGLFGLTNGGAVISGIDLTDAYVNGRYQSGPLIGSIIGATDVHGCKSSGEAVLTEDDVGGLIGRVWLDAVTGESVNILGCSSGVNVACKSESAGGLLGRVSIRSSTNRFQCNDCHATGDITLTEIPSFVGSEAGGFVGVINGQSTRAWTYFRRCYATGNIKQGPDPWRSTRCAGFAAWASTCYIIQCYSLGSVFEVGDAGYWVTGGFIGYEINASIYDCYSRGTPIRGRDSVGGFVGETSSGNIRRCYSTGAPTGSIDVGGFVGDMNSSTDFYGSVWDKETSGKDTSPGGGIGKTTAQMKDIQTFLDLGYDFVNIWLIDPNLNDGYPTFKRLAEAGPIWM